VLGVQGHGAAQMIPRTLIRFGPKDAKHPSVGTLCGACNEPLVAGDYTTLVALGPGKDVEQQKRAAAGQTYQAISLEVHWTCATGLEVP